MTSNRKADEVRNDVQDFWPPWFEVKDMGDEWAVTFPLPVYTPTRDKIQRGIATFDTLDEAEGLASELNTFVQCAIDEALLPATIQSIREQTLEEAVDRFADFPDDFQMSVSMVRTILATPPQEGDPR